MQQHVVAKLVALATGIAVIAVIASGPAPSTSTWEVDVDAEPLASGGAGPAPKAVEGETPTLVEGVAQDGPLEPPPGSIDVGAEFVIEPPSAELVHDLDERERREQIRDWAVLGTVAQLGATPNQAAAATGDLPPLRLPYLDELYAFEYGRGRRVYLGGRTLLFRDARDPDPIATIARLADRVRMENGELPDALEVYVVRDDRDEGVIHVQRAPDVTRDEAFSPAYGYVTGDGTTPEGLADWLARADDLTFAHLTNHGQLLLAGRRFPATRTPNLALDDVVALHKAHAEFDAPLAPHRAVLDRLPTKAKQAVERLREKARAGTLTDESAYPDVAAIEKHTFGNERQSIAWALRETLAPGKSPGFSLDPAWLPHPTNPNHPRFLAALRAFAVDPCGNLRAVAAQAPSILEPEPDPARRSWRARLAEKWGGDVAPAAELCAELERRIAPEVQQLANAIQRATSSEWDEALAPYYQLKQRWEALPRTDPAWASARVAKAVLEFHEADSQVQCARYEGVAGTHVGMTLFYTDLLAKLWLLDHGFSAPVFEVPGFLSIPHIDLPSDIDSETNPDNATRVWFGPRANRVSRLVAADGTRFTFEQRFSRIYAAGSNPARPGVEAAPPEDSRRTLGWWDRHYDEVADYEPEYHRQNEIMKWSLITAGLSDSAIGGRLGAIAVDRTTTFESWRRSMGNTLRFARDLPAVHAAIPGKECIPLLASYSFMSGGTMHALSGGVSTVARDALQITPKVNLAGAFGTRKAFVTEAGGAAANTVTRARPVIAHGRVTFENASRARTIARSGPVKLGEPVIDYEAGKAPREIVIRAGSGDTAVGELQLASNGNRMRQTWRNGAVQNRLTDAAPSAQTIQAADALARDRKLLQAAEAYARLVANPRNASDLARRAVMYVSHGNHAQAFEALRRLVAQHHAVDASARSALVAALELRTTAAVARRVKDMLERGVPLSGRGEVMSVVEGRLMITRDIDEAVIARARPVPETDLSTAMVYIDGRVKAAHDGLLPDLGRSVARWRRVRGVDVQELEASALGALPDRPGALPDRLHVADGTVYESPARTAARLTAPRKIYLVRACDADGKTKDTGDDCRG